MEKRVFQGKYRGEIIAREKKGTQGGSFKSAGKKKDELGKGRDMNPAC